MILGDLFQYFKPIDHRENVASFIDTFLLKFLNNIDRTAKTTTAASRCSV